MPPARGVSTWTLIVLALGCGAETIPAPPAEFAHAGTWPECGPADGPAVAIYLATDPFVTPVPEGPYVLIYVARSATRLTDRPWALGANQPDGSASSCASADECEVASGGTLTVSAVDADTTIEGSVDLDFPGAGRVTGDFRAEWLPLRFHVATRRCLER